MTRRDFIRSAATAGVAASLPSGAAAASPRPRRLADVGWCWDGQGLNGQWRFSIFGAGEGTKWFGLRRTCFMFHPNTAMAMEKLRDMGIEEVVCDISKWEYQKVEHPDYKGLGAPMRMNHDGRIERKCREAENVGRLSLKHPFLTGAFDDDLYGKIKTEHIKPDDYAVVHRAVKSVNPKLNHWGVVYAHELKKENWAGFTDFLDVVSFWVWKSADLVNLDRYVAECRELFPGKPINVGCYLRDFTLLEAVPMDLLKHQWKFVAKAVGDGTIQGFQIISGKLIDMHPQQATWVRDFIKAN
jgi:hypothetical protein